MTTTHEIVGTIKTVRGRTIHLKHPDPEVVDIDDIAHALSMLCRFGGHTRFFYSVAEHSINVLNAIRGDKAILTDLQKHDQWALLHDAAEAYLCDIPKPLKELLSDYSALENGWTLAIATRFGLKLPIPEAVKHHDKALCVLELAEARDGWTGRFVGCNPITAKRNFLTLWEEAS